MNEYQYYEFQAIDRPLDNAARKALRKISTRARITSASFTVHYDWSDLKADPQRLVERWFDLHLNVGYGCSRRLMIRLPKKLVDRGRLKAFLSGAEVAEVIDSGENLIVDILHEFEPQGYDWDDGSGWLSALAPLRAALLAGDMRLPYMIWLTRVESGEALVDEREPLPGIGPLNGGLETFAEFLQIDPDLVQAASETPAGSQEGTTSPESIRAAVMEIPETEKAAFLQRLAEGDPHVAAEVQKRVREAPSGEATAGTRTVSELLKRAEAIGEARRAAQAERREAERLESERLEERLRRFRINEVRRRGADVWREVETEIERRVHTSYDRAAELLVDLRDLAEEDEALPAFSERLDALRERHSRKVAFLRRLDKLD